MNYFMFWGIVTDASGTQDAEVTESLRVQIRCFRNENEMGQFSYRKRLLGSLLTFRTCYLPSVSSQLLTNRPFY